MDIETVNTPIVITSCENGMLFIHDNSEGKTFDEIAENHIAKVESKIHPNNLFPTSYVDFFCVNSKFRVAPERKPRWRKIK